MLVKKDNPLYELYTEMTKLGYDTSNVKVEKKGEDYEMKPSPMKNYFNTKKSGTN